MPIRNGQGALEPTWGEEVFLLRKRRGRVSLRDAAEVITAETQWPVNAMTLQRIEQLDEAPSDPRVRIAATLALRGYGYTNVEAFGLSTDDLPRSITEKRLRDLELAMSRCTLASAV